MPRRTLRKRAAQKRQRERPAGALACVAFTPISKPQLGLNSTPWNVAASSPSSSVPFTTTVFSLTVHLRRRTRVEISQCRRTVEETQPGSGDAERAAACAERYDRGVILGGERENSAPRASPGAYRASF